MKERVGACWRGLRTTKLPNTPPEVMHQQMSQTGSTHAHRGVQSSHYPRKRAFWLLLGPLGTARGRPQSLPLPPSTQGIHGARPHALERVRYLWTNSFLGVQLLPELHPTFREDNRRTRGSCIASPKGHESRLFVLHALGLCMAHLWGLQAPRGEGNTRRQEPKSSPKTPYQCGHTVGLGSTRRVGGAFLCFFLLAHHKTCMALVHNP